MNRLLDALARWVILDSVRVCQVGWWPGTGSTNPWAGYDPLWCGR